MCSSVQALSAESLTILCRKVCVVLVYGLAYGLVLCVSFRSDFVFAPRLSLTSVLPVVVWSVSGFFFVFLLLCPMRWSLMPQEILAANPDAKVVVTERDADAWWKSMYATIHREGPCWRGWGK